MCPYECGFIFVQGSYQSGLLLPQWGTFKIQRVNSKLKFSVIEQILIN